ncbi:MAG: hypothetical protein ACRELB_26355, partial [Polyangiaceae bacterium]
AYSRDIDTAIEASMQPSRTSLFALTALVAVLAAPAARGQDRSSGTPQAASPTAEPSLDAHYARVIADATRLCERYKQAIAAKVDALCAGDAGLARLREAGLFTTDAMLAPVPQDDPLAALPVLRTTYYSVDAVAEEKSKEYAGMIKQKNEDAAIALLKRIAKAQELFRDEDRDGNGISDYTEKLGDLSLAGLTLSGKMKGSNQAIVDGYTFRVLRADPLHWAGDARPERPGRTGDRFFYIDETGIIRAERGKEAGEGSEPVK